jgi:hypothetical protein
MSFVKLRGWVLAAGLLLTAVWACTPSEQNAKDQAVSAAEAGDMYQASELAALMRAMASGHEAQKAKFAAGEWDADVLRNWREIHANMQSAQATKPQEIGDVFREKSAEYLVRMDEVIRLVEAKAPQSEKRDAYNSLIETCVGCHQEHCQGPIPRIEKMKLPGDVPAGNGG